MPFDKALHPSCDTEGPFGVPMSDQVAKGIEALLKAHPKHDEAIVKLAGAAEVEIDSERTEISKITTESVDRDREVVIAKGIDLSFFRENPVVLLNHDWYGLPIGKSLWEKRFSEGDNRGLKAKTLYAKRPDGFDGEWVPDSVLALVKQGVMRGKSIGFICLERRAVEKSDIAANPTWKDARSIIPKSVLLEFSAVAIPSNADALCETALKSFPATAALLNFKAKEPTPPAEITLDQVLAELAAIKTAFAAQPELAPLLTRILTLEEERDALKRAIRGIRKRQIKGTRIAQPAEKAPDLQSALTAAFQKIARAS